MTRARDDAAAKLWDLVRPGVDCEHGLLGRDFTARRDDLYASSALDLIDRRPLEDAYSQIENQRAQPPYE